MNVQVSSSDERAVDVGAHFVRVPAAELDREDDHQRRDQHDEERADRRDEQIEQVDLASRSTDALGGNRGKGSLHLASTRCGRCDRAALPPFAPQGHQNERAQTAARSAGRPPAPTFMIAKPYLPVVGVVVVTEQQRLIDDRADLARSTASISANRRSRGANSMPKR